MVYITCILGIGEDILGIGDTMLWMVLLGGRSRSEEDVVGDPRIRNSSHSAAHLS